MMSNEVVGRIVTEVSHLSQVRAIIAMIRTGGLNPNLGYDDGNGFFILVTCSVSEEGAVSGSMCIPMPWKKFSDSCEEGLISINMPYAMQAIGTPEKLEFGISNEYLTKMMVTKNMGRIPVLIMSIRTGRKPYPIFAGA
jgi:hypothetical protein